MWCRWTRDKLHSDGAAGSTELILLLFNSVTRRVWKKCEQYGRTAVIMVLVVQKQQEDVVATNADTHAAGCWKKMLVQMGQTATGVRRRVVLVHVGRHSGGNKC